jgi:hypothetical protein
MKTVYRPNTIDLNKIVLLNSESLALDITELVREFNIFHDILSYGTQAELVMVDSVGLPEYFPIVGDEYLYIKFQTPSFPDEFEREYLFSVNNITSRNIKEKTQTYIIKCMSPEVVTNYRKVVNKSYIDQTGSDIVTKIFNDYLKPNDVDHRTYIKKQELNVVETTGSMALVFANKTPFEAIKQVGNEAVHPTLKSSSFLFYHNYDGWNFNTIEGMLNIPEGDEVETFYMLDAQLEKISQDDYDKTKSITEDQKITSIEIKRQPSTFESIQNGLFMNTIETIDPILKRFTRDKFIYENDYDDIVHIEKNGGKIYTENSLFKKETENNVKKMIISNIGENYRNLSYLKTASSNDAQIRNPRRLHTFAKYDMATRAGFMNTVVSLMIPGNTKVGIGDIIKIAIPQQDNYTEPVDKRLNLLISNRYLITALRHTYTADTKNFFTVLECVKDNYLITPVYED